ncbi:site-specific integrase [Paraburkholderia sp. RL17-337-BIB-A]|uniref:site-specific integrase n=1 Tax=Paraburkholderia sp. RL17-337-BIB-A TaxID=3031636 RepID=UPI0038BCD22A
MERGASENTCESYEYAFKLLLEFASRRLKTQRSQLYLEQIDAPMILSFLDHLETTRHNGANSRNTRLAAIKSFIRFVEYRVLSTLE